MSGLSVIDPDQEMLEADEKQFHLATICTSLQARSGFHVLKVPCSFMVALSACTEDAATYHLNSAVPLPSPHGAEGGGRDKCLRGLCTKTTQSELSMLHKGCGGGA